MMPLSDGRDTSVESSRARLAQRLCDTQPEIEEKIFARVSAVDDRAGSSDAQYLVGLRAVVSALLEYALGAVRDGDAAHMPIPSVAIEQARLAARAGVPLETVWLRYCVGLRELDGFVVDGAEDLSGRALREVLDVQWSLVERLLAAISAEYRAERKRLGSSNEQRRAQRVRNLLAGEPAELGDLAYDFDLWHTAFIVAGTRAREAARDLASLCGRQLLVCPQSGDLVWAWLGGQSELVVDEIDFHRVPALGAADTLLAMGECAPGLEGWRLTHNQAQAALLVALHTGQKITRCTGVMLLAVALQNETLARSLESVYLAPLAAQRDGGAVWRETLRAYFEAEGNTATTANAMGVNRHTVLRRLRSIERALGQLIGSCRSELEIALRLHDIRSRARAADDATRTEVAQRTSNTAPHWRIDRSFSSGTAE